MDSKKQPKWLDRFLVSHPDHVNELEQAAALHEFDSKMPRHQAEEKAYSDYRKQQHLHGAAHHLRGLKAAQASGDQDDARKHSAMLELHAKQAGFDPYSDLPAELQQHLHAEKPEPVHKFKAHRSDLFVLDDHKKEVQKAEAREQLGRILKKAELAQLLKGDVIQFPKNRVPPAVDHGAPASVRAMHPVTDCKLCHQTASSLLSGDYAHASGPAPKGQDEYDQALGPATSKIFREKHAASPLTEKHRALTTLLHARHSFQKK